MANINSFIEEDIKRFKEISFKIGSNIKLVQAAGGNTSIKSNNSMLIKASGKWLNQSLNENIFVEVNLNSIRKKINNNQEGSFDEDILSNNNLRPSIETSFHALIEYKYVLHVHSTAVISSSIPDNCYNHLKEILGNKILCVPYVRPGFPLTLEIKKKYLKHKIIILQNHGLIIADDNIEEAYRSLIEVHQALENFENNFENLNFNENNINKIGRYSLVKDSKFNIFRSSDKSLHQLFSKSFYPDHVIFLGPGIQTFYSPDEVEIFLSKLEEEGVSLPPYFIVFNKGLYEINNVSNAAKEMIFCFKEVLLQLNTNNNLRFLTRTEENELLNWDAEKYRQANSR